MIQNIVEMFRTGQPLLYILCGVWCVGLVIIFERLIVLKFVYTIDFTKFNHRIKQMLLAQDIERAQSLCQAFSATSLPRMVYQSLRDYQGDTARLQALLHEESLRFLPHVRRRLSQLPHLASLCALLGAAGSVYSVWHAFEMAKGWELGIKSLVFASSMTHALLPLFLALAAAATLVAAFGVLDAIAVRLEGEIEHGMWVVLNTFEPRHTPVFRTDGHEPPQMVEPPPKKNAAAKEGEPPHEEPAVGTPNTTLSDEEEVI